jgi:AraC-like DNA-binding protein
MALLIQHREDTFEAYQVSIERVIGYMQRHLVEPMDLDHLARVAALSKFHFVKVFEESTGTTPHHFLACLRIERAKERLLHSEQSITEICMEVGYSSLGSFSQTFHQLVGLSPKEFRAMPARLTLRQLAKAARRWIGSHQWAAGPQVHGVITAPPKTRGFIFVGVFTGGVPQGRPASGTVLLGPGAFRMARPSTAAFHVLAALIPFSSNLKGLVGNLPIELVASERVQMNGSESASLELRLRPLRVTDPPIVIALPALLL